MNSKQPNSEAQDIGEILKPAVLAEINLKRREGTRYSQKMSEGTVAPSQRFGITMSNNKSHEGSARDNDSPGLKAKEGGSPNSIDMQPPMLFGNISIENLEDDKTITKEDMGNTRTKLR